MNHKAVYDGLIIKAKSENREKLKRDDKNFVYYEKHHIVPTCLGGANSQENLVLLTAKEHFVAHKLLNKIYPENRKLINAVWMMSVCKKGGLRDYRVSAREYEILKIEHSLNVSEAHTGRVQSEEAKRKFSLKTKGRVSYKKGVPGKPHSEESKIKIPTL